MSRPASDKPFQFPPKHTLKITDKDKIAKINVAQYLLTISYVLPHSGVCIRVWT